jgi:hypothetical protein
MIRLFALAALAGLLTVFSLGCRTSHLGPNTGDSYRAAFNKQVEAAEGSDDEAPSLSADDAKHAMKVHATGEDKPSSPATLGAPSLSLPSGMSSSTAGGGKWPGASGNIKLEAK